MNPEQEEQFNYDDKIYRHLKLSIDISTWIRIGKEKGYFEYLKNEVCKCGAKLIPAEDCKNFTTGEWDGHSWKYDCDCQPNIRISIG